MPPWMLVLPLATALWAAVTDARTGRIPNWLTATSFALALGARGVWGGGPALLDALLAVVLVSLPCAWLFLRRALGGGDLKLFAALAAALGPGLGLRAQLLSFLLVSGYALFVAVWDGRAWALLRLSGAATLHLFAPQRFARPAPVEGLRSQLRMGPFIGLACLLVALEAWL